MKPNVADRVFQRPVNVVPKIQEDLQVQRKSRIGRYYDPLNNLKPNTLSSSLLKNDEMQGVRILRNKV